MNTRASVVYGWGILVVAAGAAYAMAKPSIDERRRTATENGSRPMEIKSWQDRIAESERAVMSNATTSTPGAKAAVQTALLGSPSDTGSSGLGAGLENTGRGVGVGPGKQV